MKRRYLAAISGEPTRKEHTLSAGETIELPEDARTIWRVSDVPLTITIAG